MAPTSRPDGCTGGGRCAEWSLTSGESLAGTAPVFDGVLLVEWPPPWPADAKEVAPLAPLAAECAAAGIRLQLIWGPATPRSAERRVILYRRTATAADCHRFGRAPAAGFGRFERAEVVADSVDVAAAIVALLNGGPEANNDNIQDVLVCTHGSRDVCCGAKGMPLVRAAAGDLRFAGVRLWRTSHLGGHRFAPTALLLPEGTMWGRLTLDLFAAAVTGVSDYQPLRACFRGNISDTGPEGRRG